MTHDRCKNLPHCAHCWGRIKKDGKNVHGRSCVICGRAKRRQFRKQYPDHQLKVFEQLQYAKWCERYGALPNWE